MCKLLFRCQFLSLEKLTENQYHSKSIIYRVSKLHRKTNVLSKIECLCDKLTLCL